MKRRIIAIHGLMGHGKDTLGCFIASNIRIRRRIKKSFALKVKENVSNITGVHLGYTFTSFYDNQVFDFTRDQKNRYLDEWGMTLGEMLQRYATEACRDNICEDVWIKPLIREMRSSEDVYIITDLRFENEVLALKEMGAVLVKVIRPNYSGDEKRDVNHKSEKGLPNEMFDHIVINDGDRVDLANKAKDIVSKNSLDD